MSDKKFIDGLIFKPPHENAPDFIIAKISIEREDVIAWLEQQSGDWINADLKESKEGKLYASVDDWKPDGQRQGNGNSTPRRNAPQPKRRQPPPQDDVPFDDDIPFITAHGRF